MVKALFFYILLLLAVVLYPAHETYKELEEQTVVKSVWLPITEIIYEEPGLVETNARVPVEAFLQAYNESLPTYVWVSDVQKHQWYVTVAYAQFDSESRTWFVAEEQHSWEAADIEVSNAVIKEASIIDGKLSVMFKQESWGEGGFLMTILIALILSILYWAMYGSYLSNY